MTTLQTASSFGIASQLLRLVVFTAALPIGFLLLAPATAKADGWSGYIAIEGTRSVDNDSSTRTERDRALYLFDDDPADLVRDTGPHPDARIWEQKADWQADHRWRQSSKDTCFTDNRDGEGTGTMTVRIWIENGYAAPPNPPAKHLLVSGLSGDFTYPGTTTQTYPGSSGGCEPSTFDWTGSVCGPGIGFDPLFAVAAEGTASTTLEGRLELVDGYISGHYVAGNGIGCNSGLLDGTLDYYLTRDSDPPECADGIDNDDDGLTDYAGGVAGYQDPGCESATDDSESDPECSDDKNNDFDALTDYPLDPGCTSETDESEFGTAECDNGKDDDGDGFIDVLDDYCQGDPLGEHEANEPPTARDFDLPQDRAMNPEESADSILIDVSPYVDDPDGDPVSLFGGTIGTDLGEVVVVDERLLKFTPPPDFVGTAHLNYSVTDDEANESNLATITIPYRVCNTEQITLRNTKVNNAADNMTYGHEVRWCTDGENARVMSSTVSAHDSWRTQLGHKLLSLVSRNRVNVVSEWATSDGQPGGSSVTGSADNQICFTPGAKFAPGGFSASLTDFLIEGFGLGRKAAKLVANALATSMQSDLKACLPDQKWSPSTTFDFRSDGSFTLSWDADDPSTDNYYFVRVVHRDGLDGVSGGSFSSDWAGAWPSFDCVPAVDLGEVVWYAAECEYPTDPFRG